MTKKTGLTFERHQEVGAELQGIYTWLQELYVEFSKAYPLTGDAGRPHKEIEKALKAISTARSGAEANLFRDHPDQATTDIYYGNSEAAGGKTRR